MADQQQQAPDIGEQVQQQEGQQQGQQPQDQQQPQQQAHVQAPQVQAQGHQQPVVESPAAQFQLLMAQPSVLQFLQLMQQYGPAQLQAHPPVLQLPAPHGMPVHQPVVQEVPQEQAHQQALPQAGVQAQGQAQAPQPAQAQGQAQVPQQAQGVGLGQPQVQPQAQAMHMYPLVPWNQLGAMNANHIHQPSAARTVPLKLRPLKSTEALEVHAFLRRYSGVARRKGWTDADMIGLLPEYLTDEAAATLERIIDHLPANCHFDEAVQRIMEELCDNLPRYAYRQLDQIRQKDDESLSNYLVRADQVIEFIRQVSPQTDDARYVSALLGGLRDKSIRYDLLRFPHVAESLDSLRTELRRIAGQYTTLQEAKEEMEVQEVTSKGMSYKRRQARDHDEDSSPRAKRPKIKHVNSIEQTNRLQKSIDELKKVMMITTDRSNGRRVEMKEEEKKKPSSTPTKKKKYCEQCDKDNHDKKNCFAYCYYCGMKGHNWYQCRHRKKDVDNGKVIERSKELIQKYRPELYDTLPVNGNGKSKKKVPTNEDANQHHEGQGNETEE